jgi:hypothetical protein
MWLSGAHYKEFPHDRFESSSAENQIGIPLIYLGGDDRYKIIDTCVAVKSRCVPETDHIA